MLGHSEVWGEEACNAHNPPIYSPPAKSEEIYVYRPLLLHPLNIKVNHNTHNRVAVDIKRAPRLTPASSFKQNMNWKSPWTFVYWEWTTKRESFVPPPLSSTLAIYTDLHLYRPPWDFENCESDVATRRCKWGGFTHMRRRPPMGAQSFWRVSLQLAALLAILTAPQAEAPHIKSNS